VQRGLVRVQRGLVRVRRGLVRVRRRKNNFSEENLMRMNLVKHCTVQVEKIYLKECREGHQKITKDWFTVSKCQQTSPQVQLVCLSAYINYLCTFDLYSPEHNVFDACISITRASGRRLGPGI
jgi:hypothetical protein